MSPLLVLTYMTALNQMQGADAVSINYNAEEELDTDYSSFLFPPICLFIFIGCPELYKCYVDPHLKQRRLIMASWSFQLVLIVPMFVLTVFGKVIPEGPRHTLSLFVDGLYTLLVFHFLWRLFKAHKTAAALQEPNESTPLMDIYLRSNDEGIIRLGDLQDVTGVICYTTNSTWSLLTQDQHKYPDYINGFTGDSIRVPFAWRGIVSLRALSLFRRSPGTGADQQVLENQTCHVEDLTINITLSYGLLTIENLELGYYTLGLGEDHIIELNIANSIKSSSTVVQQAPIKDFEEFIHSNPMLEIQSSSKCPLFLATSLYESLTEDSRLSIRVHNWTSMTRVCIVATKFQPYKTLFEATESFELKRPWIKNQLGRTPITYRTGRTLGDGHQSIGDTTISRQYMEASSYANAQTTSNTFGSTENYYGGKELDRGGSKRHSKTLPPVLLNLIPDSTTGEIIVTYAEFKEGNFVQILVTDARNEFSKRDLRFKSALDHEKHYIGERTGVNLDPKIEAGAADSAGAAVEQYYITLPSNGSSSSSMRVIHSVSEVYDLMMTLLESQTHRITLRKFRFIVNWH
ncbi:hypothetical protein BGZ98_006471 [Dissophora globulifera]|nr:hypothetical protein BGZ98_006471 [Dissophora globulifera]